MAGFRLNGDGLQNDASVANEACGVNDASRGIYKARTPVTQINDPLESQLGPKSEQPDGNHAGTASYEIEAKMKKVKKGVVELRVDVDQVDNKKAPIPEGKDVAVMVQRWVRKGKSRKYIKQKTMKALLDVDKNGKAVYKFPVSRNSAWKAAGFVKFPDAKKYQQALYSKS